MRRGWLLGVAVLALAGCTASTGSRPATPSVAPTSALPHPTSAPPCPTPAVPTTPPTDFPHPTLARVTPTGAAGPEDVALARQGLAALQAFGGPVSAGAFQHYLDATGEYLTLPVDDLLTADPALVTELGGVLVRSATAAVASAANGGPCTTVPFSSGWRGHADVDDPDWRYTLGRFDVEVTGTATRAADGGVTVAYRAAIGDTYDFDPGSTFAQFGRLADDGHAAVFLDGGLTTLRHATVSTAAALASPGFG